MHLLMSRVGGGVGLTWVKHNILNSGERLVKKKLVRESIYNAQISGQLIVESSTYARGGKW